MRVLSRRFIAGRSRARATRRRLVLVADDATVGEPHAHATHARATSGSCVISTIVRPDGVQTVEEVEHLAGRRGVEVSGGLVGEDDRGIGDDRARDRDALLLAARQLRRLVLGAIREPDHLERGAGPLRPLARLHSRVDQRQLDVAERARCAGSG